HEVVLQTVRHGNAIFDARIRRRLVRLVDLGDPALNPVLNPKRDACDFGHKGTLRHRASYWTSYDERLEKTFPDEDHWLLAHVLGNFERGFALQLAERCHVPVLNR